MSDAWRSAKIREFEHVAAGAAIALLRVTAKPSRWGGGTAARPVLLADDGRSVKRFTPLPSPPDARGVLRAAYSVPATLIAAEANFALEASDGGRIPLPRPTPAATQPALRTPAAPVGDPRPDAVQPQAEGARPGEHPAAAETETEAEAEVRRLAARLTETEADRDRAEAALAELETWRGELERRLAATTTELGDARIRLREDTEELGRLRDALAAAEARAEQAETQLMSLRGRTQASLPEVVSEAPAASGTGGDSLDGLIQRAEARAADAAARELAQAAASHARSGQ